MTEQEGNRLFERLFVFLSVLVFLLFLGQLWKDYNRPYLEHQNKFTELMIQKVGKPLVPNQIRLGIRQQWNKDLNRADRCETCHLGIDDPRFQDAPQPFKTHPVASRHPFEKFGCTVCHSGQGLATTMEDAHGPTDNWKAALYHADFMENSCSLCHGEFIGEQAPVLAKGRAMFNEYGCRGCHKIKGKENIKLAPPLDDMGKRVKPDWLYRWAQNPKDYLPKTRMPDSKLSPQESADVASFLLQGIKAEGLTISGSRERGKTIFREARCVTCHAVEGKGGTTGPELARISSKAYPERLFHTIKEPHALWPESKMPVFGFPEQDIADLVTFMVEEYVDLELDEQKAAQQVQTVKNASTARGQELVEKYGCIGCHTKVKEVKERAEIAPELTTIGTVHISRMDFGELKVPPSQRTVANWLYNKVKDSRLFKQGLKMPDFAFSNVDAEAMTTYLLSFKEEEVPDSYTLPLGERPSRYAPQGAFGEIVDKYRCFVCHKISGRGGEIANDLSQEGSRVQEGWLRKFMKSPDTIRPLLEERMPQFKFSDSENEVLYAYCRTTLVDDRVEDLASMVGQMRLNDPNLIREGENLYFKKYGCNACHQINLMGGTLGPDLTEAGKRLRPEWVVYYLHNPKAFVKRSVEPVYVLTDPEIEALTAYLINPKAKSSDMR